MKGKPKRRHQFVAMVLGFLCAFVMPAMVTAIAPVSWVNCVREGERVAATARTCVFFFIPYRTQRVERVTGFDFRARRGELLRREPGERQRQRTEDEAHLIIEGAPADIEVPLSPANVEKTLAKARAFLADGSDSSVRLATVANWKAGVIAGIPLTLLALLYVLGVALSLGRWVVKTGIGDRGIERR